MPSAARRKIEPLSLAQFAAEWRRDHPADDPAAIRWRIETHCRKRAQFDDAQIEAVFVEALVEALARTVRDRKERRAASPEAEAAKQQVAETMQARFEEKIETAATIRLLEYLTPYGKAVGDCTGAECQRLSRRYGGFFAELAKRITRGEMVRAHLSEAELQEIAKTHRLIGPRAHR